VQASKVAYEAYRLHAAYRFRFNLQHSNVGGMSTLHASASVEGLPAARS
jgi:hypothetical protein